MMEVIGKVAMLPLFLHVLLPAGTGRQEPDPHMLIWISIHFNLFINVFCLIRLLDCHETSSMQRVALRRIASLASCIPDLFRGFEESR